MARKRGPVPGSKNRIAYTNICEWCGKHFDCARPDKKTCDNRCKLRFTRWVRKVFKANGQNAKWGPRGEWSKCLQALQPDWNGRYVYERPGSQK